MSITLGTIGEVFAKTLITNVSGKTSFKMLNPSFANTATISALATIGSEITSAEFQLYFRADVISYIKLSGSPEVISTNGDRASIIAVAYDSMDNLIKDAYITFNLIDGPGGGEYLDPAIVTTGIDGSAETYLISGPIPSEYHGVKVVAGDFSTIKSDTIQFTIAGPPHNITIRSNIGTLTKYQSTYGKNVAAIVTDVNGNPVADGTEVTFSLNITGYKIYKLRANFEVIPYRVDTICGGILIFEDLNNNFIMDDPSEDINGDGILNRGENLNGDKDKNGDTECRPIVFLAVPWPPWQSP